MNKVLFTLATVFWREIDALANSLSNQVCTSIMVEIQLTKWKISSKERLLSLHFIQWYQSQVLT